MMAPMIAMPMTAQPVLMSHSAFWPLRLRSFLDSFLLVRLELPFISTQPRDGDLYSMRLFGFSSSSCEALQRVTRRILQPFCNPTRLLPRKSGSDHRVNLFRGGFLQPGEDVRV